MRLILLAIILSIFVTDAQALKIDAADVIDISTVSMNDEGEIVGAIAGTITGIEQPPKGDYQVNITNGNGFKGDAYSLMECNILPLQEIKYAKSVPLNTTFVADGKFYNAMGFFSGSTAIPDNGYKVVIKNGGSRSEWNTMNCRIK